MTISSLEASEALSARNAPAPRVSLDDMKARIAQVYYINAGEAIDRDIHLPSPGLNNPLRLLTLCFLVLDNGFTVVGKSAPASAENFDADKGRTFAHEDAIRQLWPLMGFALRDHLTYGGSSWWAQPGESAGFPGSTAEY